MTQPVLRKFRTGLPIHFKSPSPDPGRHLSLPSCHPTLYQPPQRVCCAPMVHCLVLTLSTKFEINAPMPLTPGKAPHPCVTLHACHRPVLLPTCASGHILTPSCVLAPTHMLPMCCAPPLTHPQMAPNPHPPTSLTCPRCTTTDLTSQLLSP